MRRAIGFIAAAQHSYSSCQQYRENVAAARAAAARGAPAADVDVTYVGSWFDHPLFIEANAAHVRAALERLPAEVRAAARLVFTAHSIPLPMAERVALPGAAARVGAAGRRRAPASSDWALVYQSRSGRPRIRGSSRTSATTCAASTRAGLQAAVLCPIGFVCDHIEVLYDLDREAADVCREIGLPMARAEAVNDDPLFLDMMADVVLRTIRALRASAGRCRDCVVRRSSSSA